MTRRTMYILAALLFLLTAVAGALGTQWVIAGAGLTLAMVMLVLSMRSTA